MLRRDVLEVRPYHSENRSSDAPSNQVENCRGEQQSSKAIFPNYPRLDRCTPNDGKGEQESELLLQDTVV